MHASRCAALPLRTLPPPPPPFVLPRLRERPDLGGSLVAERDFAIGRLKPERAANTVDLPYLEVHARHQAAVEQVTEERRRLPLRHFRDPGDGGLHPLLQCREPPLAGAELCIARDWVAVWANSR